MRTPAARGVVALSVFALPLVFVRPARAISITFDYSHDTTGFFSDPARKSLLNQAASYYTPFTDSLSALIPSGSNTFTPTFPDPVTGVDTTTPNLNVPANTLVVYVGARLLGGATLGQGGPGGYSSFGTSSWNNTVATRGQAGATQNSSTSTEFGPWGGAISFDSSTNWYFGSSISGISGSQADFLSVAIHELGHVLGFGTAASFDHYVSGTTFTGPTAESKHAGTPVPLNAGTDHWAQGTASVLPGTATSQETSMDPAITLGTRKLPTVLDYAALKDIGWQVPASDLATLARLPGDVNGDGFVNSGDINAFIYALANSPSGFQAQYPGGVYTNADVNGTNHAGDGFVNAADINPFIAILSGTGEPGITAALAAVPEPTSLSLLIPAAAALHLRRRRRP